MQSKNVNNKNCAPKFVFYIKKFWCRKLTLKVKGKMHKKAYEHIWLHFFCFFWFLSFFPLVPLGNLEKKVVLAQIWVSHSNGLKKKAFAESFIKIGWKLKKRQPNVLISLFMHFPFHFSCTNHVSLIVSTAELNPVYLSDQDCCVKLVIVSWFW